MKELFRQDQIKKFKGFDLPTDRTTDLRDIYKEKSPISIDSMALFSASQRANKGRARYRHGGMTASIYLSDKLGSHQVGSLFSTICVKNNAAFLTSIPTLKIEYVAPVLTETIPHNSFVCGDMEYKWYVNKNLRLVNHSAKAKSKKGRWSKHRWVTEQGVHNNSAEATQGVFKTYCRNYRYFSAKYSQLYANEFCFLKNIRFYSIKRLQNTKSQKSAVGIVNNLALSVPWLQSPTTPSQQTDRYFL